MLVEEAIRTRPSIKVFSGEAVVDSLVAALLDAAVWAPNHHLTEPWHFSIVSGADREAFARVVRTEMLAHASGIDAAIVQAKALKERQKLLSAPVIVAIYSDAGPDDRATRENFAASAAAAQNVLLLAHSTGLAGIWRTSAIYELPGVRSALRARPGAIFVGALCLGYPMQRNVRRRRTPAVEKTYWFKSEDLEPHLPDAMDSPVSGG